MRNYRFSPEVKAAAVCTDEEAHHLLRLVSRTVRSLSRAQLGKVTNVQVCL